VVAEIKAMPLSCTRESVKYFTASFQKPQIMLEYVLASYLKVGIDTLLAGGILG
jgi:hypothetical protein